ncbi:Type-1 restriction enzyme EcoKI specificity protein [Burkholderia cenocepacia]|uniref:Type-1 restriction enzyme EcoKI specificity protein n=1 Tax=Burkholderia cenocepacia TaxID=95486 RepID=A0A6J5J9G4_9BURK|nr:MULTISPECIES: restriction endonuclease subunit S [Burkholderia cepacia complex]CAB3968095.1 Type-1 restriction enzyme EcoKI specificity protein [Burkholderia cenocepacia]
MIFDEENIPQLPMSWAVLSVEEAFEQVTVGAKKLKTKDALEQGRFPVIDQGASETSGYTDDANLVISASQEAPIVLFGDHTRVLKYITTDFVPGADGTKLLAPKEMLDHAYAYQVLRAIRLPDRGYGRHYQYLRSSIIPIAPLAEQKRIADTLDRVLARVEGCRERLDRIPAILKRFRQTVLAAAMSGRLTADWRDGCGASEDAPALLQKVQAAKLSWADSNSSHNESGRVSKRASGASQRAFDSRGLPDSWRWSALEDALLMVVDCHNKTAPYEQTGIPLVRTSNIRDRAIIWADMKYVNEVTYTYWSRRCPPEGGDLIFTREAPMGEVAIVPSEPRFCLGQRTMLFRPVDSLISGRYLLISVSEPHFKIRSELVAVGSGVKHLRVGDVSELLVPIPPKEEQDEIVRRVEKLFAIADRLEERVNNARRAADRLTPALLAKAFRGELVPQDPNDEPAEELIERLKALTTSLGTKGKRSKRPSAAAAEVS